MLNVSLITESSLGQQDLPGVSNLRPMGCTQPRMAVNAAQHKTLNLLKTL